VFADILYALRRKGCQAELSSRLELNSAELSSSQQLSEQLSPAPNKAETRIQQPQQFHLSSQASCQHKRLRTSGFCYHRQCFLLT
jgi:hypothetical protein